MSRQELLANIPIFESLTADDLESLVARLEEISYAQDDVIFRQGEEGSSLFIIEDGAVDISYGEGRTKVSLASLYPGQFFGELSLFDGAPRSATASAIKPSRLVRLDRDDFADFLNKNPAASLRIISELSDRLRQTNELMSRQVSRNVLEEQEGALTFGQRVADRVAAFGGSWPFIGLFTFIMAIWMGANIARKADFDPYPFILLNLCLSTVAALQAPIIMMSQNRQSMKDKLLAENDYQVNLKAEMEIEALLRGQSELIARVALLERMLMRRQHVDVEITSA
ncbi:MAG: Acid-resistant locus arl7 [Acidobacteria bacterium]|nr:Acid-resistant locus arl7 [Acidobacteriota bacterium]